MQVSSSFTGLEMSHIFAVTFQSTILFQESKSTWPIFTVTMLKAYLHTYDTMALRNVSNKISSINVQLFGFLNTWKQGSIHPT
jgi:hypothetical protein